MRWHASGHEYTHDSVLGRLILPLIVLNSQEINGDHHRDSEGFYLRSGKADLTSLCDCLLSTALCLFPLAEDIGRIG